MPSDPRLLLSILCIMCDVSRELSLSQRRIYDDAAAGTSLHNMRSCFWTHSAFLRNSICFDESPTDLSAIIFPLRVTTVFYITQNRFTEDRFHFCLS